MNRQTDQSLLQEYAERQSETAFGELVRRHIDLVHSAALRMVRDAHLAQDVTQGVFVALAGQARQLVDRPVLSGWLHLTARNLAANAVRSEVRRRTREEEAVAMNDLLSDSPNADWDSIAPHLDAVLGELTESDRDALLLRYFERKSAREIAQTLGISDDAAQRRVSRAVERLRELFAKRGVPVGTSGLVAVVSANAVQAAPVGLAVTVTALAANLTGAALTTISTTSAATTIAMTTLQKALISGVLITALGVTLYQAREVTRLRESNRALQQQNVQWADQVEKWQRDHAAAQTRAPALANSSDGAKTNPLEVLKLRGQVGVLRQEKADLGRKSALSKITADPDARKAMRDQQKMGMKLVFSDLVKRLNLSPESEAQFHDLLADEVMNNIDLITQSLLDKPGSAEIDQLFSAQEAALQDKLAALLGPEMSAQYRDYSRDIAGHLTVAQFADNLTGSADEMAGKKQQLLQTMREETRAALAAAGLPADYQTLPMLNFRNIASEEKAEQSLKLMNTVFERVAARASGYLSADEIQKFQDFGQKALDNNRAALLMNRKIMAPIAE